MPTTRPRKTPLERCQRTVDLIAEATGEDWTFGYIGNVELSGRDDRAWYAFRPHPGRVGTHDDRIGGVRTDDLDSLLPTLMGALKMARMLRA